MSKIESADPTMQFRSQKEDSKHESIEIFIGKKATSRNMLFRGEEQLEKKVPTPFCLLKVSRNSTKAMPIEKIMGGC